MTRKSARVPVATTSEGTSQIEDEDVKEKLDDPTMFRSVSVAFPSRIDSVAETNEIERTVAGHDRELLGDWCGREEPFVAILRRGDDAVTKAEHRDDVTRKLAWTTDEGELNRQTRRRRALQSHGSAHGVLRLSWRRELDGL